MLSPITQDLDVRDFCKTAGVMQALADLGLTDGMEKDAAIWGALGKGLSSLWGATGGKLVGATAAPFGWAGRGIQSAVGKVSPGAGEWLGRVGQGAAREMAGFGLLSGGINAAMAEPGERGSAFARGFAGGALGGLGWRAGGNLTRMGLGQVFGPRNMGRLTETANRGIWSNLRAGNYGQAGRSAAAGAITKGLPFAGAMGASMMMPTFETEQQQQQPQRPQGLPYAPGMVYGAGQAVTGY